MIDGSGTINSANEFKQMGVNIAFSLGITTALPLVIQAAAALPEDASMSLDEYTAWFLDVFDFKDERHEGGKLVVLGLSS